MEKNKSKTDHANGKTQPGNKALPKTDLPAKYGTEKARFIKTVEKAAKNSDKHQIPERADKL